MANWYDSYFSGGGAPAAQNTAASPKQDEWWKAYFATAPAPPPVTPQTDIIAQRANGPGSRPELYSWQKPAPPPAPQPQSNPIEDAFKFVVGHVLGTKPAAAPTSQQTAQGADLGNVLGLGSTSPGAQPTQAFQKLVAQPAPPAPKPPSIIDLIGQGAKDAVGAIVPGAKPIINAASAGVRTPEGKGIALGAGTLAINLLAGLNDPFNHDVTAGNDVEAQLRAQHQANPNQPRQPVNHTADVLNDAATGLIGRLTLGKGGAIVKGAQGLGLALFGANVVKDTPAYVQQIQDTQDPTQKFSLGTQLLGSYLLLAHGAKSATDAAVSGAKTLPTTKTQSQSVPIDMNAAVEFSRSPNPNLTDIQKQAFQQLYDQGSGAVKDAIKAGTTNVDVSVPTTYGRLISLVQSKVGKAALSPAEVAVQAAVASDPGTLVPRAEQLTKDPATLEMVRQASVPAQPAEAMPVAPVPGSKTLTRVNIPEVNIQSVPHEVTVPGAVPPPQAIGPSGTERPQPTGGGGQLNNLVQAANQAPTQAHFTEALSNFNPAQIRGFKTSDGAVVAGPGSSKQTVSVVESNAKQFTERPLSGVLADFYHQSRGEAVPASVVKDINVPNTNGTAGGATKSLKNVIRTKAQAQAAVDAQQRKINATPGPKSLKKANVAQLVSVQVPGQTKTQEPAVIKYKKSDVARYDRSVLNGVSYLRQVRGDLPFELKIGKEVAGDTLASYQRAGTMIKAATLDGKVDIRAIGHEVGHEIWANILAPEQRTAFAAELNTFYQAHPEDAIRTVAGYGFMDLPEAQQAVLTDGLKAAGDTFPKSKSGTPMQDLVLATETYLKGDREALASQLKDTAPTYARALLKYFDNVGNQITQGKLSDTVAEELWVDQNGKYVAGKTGGMSERIKAFLADLWNALKKALGANYDKAREIFKQSYEGQLKDGLNQPAKPFQFVTTKLKLADDESLWQERFKNELAPQPDQTPDEQRVWDEFATAAHGVSREVDAAAADARAASATATARQGIPAALGEVPVGDFRKLTDPLSTPTDDYRRIATANKPDTAKKIVENYDGLIELRRLKNQERVMEIFKGMSKQQDQALFDAAKAYQVAGMTNAEHHLDPTLSKVFNQVTHLYDAVGQDAFVSGRIRALRENYITQIWDKESLKETGLTPEQVNFLRGASSITTRFSLERSIKNYQQGIEMGLKPKYDKLSDLVREYLQADTRAAAGRFLADGLLALGDEHVMPSGNSQPAGWKAINKISGLRGYVVSPEVWKAIKPLESISAIRENWLGRAAVKTSQTATQILMAGDLLLLKNYFFDAPKASWFGAPKLIYEASKMTPEIRAKLITLGGLKMSNHTPEMEGSKLGKVLGTVLNEKKNPYFWADWLSFKGGDVLRNGTATMIYRKLTSKGVPEAEAAKQAVKFAQDTFGRQNLVRAGRSQTVQDILRVAMISPDYTESRFKFMGKAFKGATYKIGDTEYRRYSAGMLRYLLFAGLFLETLNLAFSGHTSDKNDEDHKWDLEVHTPTGKYYVNLLGVVKTDLRFINGIADAAQGNMTTLTRFIGNKGSALERTAQLLITGKDYQGNDIVDRYTDTPLDKWKKTALNVVNNFIPLPVQGFTQPAATKVDGEAPKGLAGFVFRTIGLDLYNTKAIPTQARQSLQELENDKQNVQLEVYSLVKQGKTDQAMALIDAFNAKAARVGPQLAKLNNISPVDIQSLNQLGTTAALDPQKLIAKAKNSSPSDHPISNLIDYGVGGTTISTTKSTSGKANAKAASVKAAKTRSLKPKKARTAKVSKAKSLKTSRPKKLKSLKVRKG